MLGVLLSYRRPASLSRSLRALSRAAPRPDALVVLDNEASAETESVVRAAAYDWDAVDYVASSQNLGAAGGRAEAMRRLLVDAADRDWIVLFDDDDPVPDSGVLGELGAFGDERRRVDPRTGAIGLRGAKFDRRRGYPVPVTRTAPQGPVAVDYLHGGFFPFYSVAAVRDVGVFPAELFFGWADLEYGLRLRERQWTLWMDADSWRVHGSAMGHPPELEGPRVRLGLADARRYYAMRNWMGVLARHAGPVAVTRMFLSAAVVKPLLNLPSEPRLALAHLRLNVRASLDAALGRSGRAWNRWTSEPPSPVEM
jgi:GT2 family glycosyltransferase